MLQPPAGNNPTPPAGRSPLRSLASPHQLRPRAPGEIQWYRPSMLQGLSLMGWRVIFFLPALLILLLLLLLPWYVWLVQLALVWWKLIVIAVALPSGYALRLATRGMQSRREPFCIHCGYDLSGLPDDHTCPECGEYYNFAVIEEYKRDPAWFIRRYHTQHPAASSSIQVPATRQ